MVMKKILIFLLFILIGNIAIAQTDFSHYLDSLNRIDYIEQVYFPKEIKKETPQMFVEMNDTPKVEDNEFDYHRILNRFYGRYKRSTGNYSTIYRKAPPRKNRVYFSFPFRTDKSIFIITEYRPTFERDITGWLSVYFGPSLYRSKFQGCYTGTYQGGGTYPLIAMFSSNVTRYFIDGWGQNYGIKIFKHPGQYGGHADNRFGLNIAYQQRNIRVYGPALNYGEVKGLEDVTTVYQDYFERIVDKTIKDGRLRLLLQYEKMPDVGTRAINNFLLVSLYGGVGLPLWGHFDDKYRKISGNRKDEWESGNTNNVIMMRNYDVYFGVSLGFYFGDFWKKNYKKIEDELKINVNK